MPLPARPPGSPAPGPPGQVSPITGRGSRGATRGPWVALETRTAALGTRVAALALAALALVTLPGTAHATGAAQAPVPPAGAAQPGAGAPAAPARIRLVTDPAPAAVRPDRDPVRLRIFVEDAAGRPVAYARLRLALDAPRHPLLHTDFPVVEGTRLWEAEVLAAGGELSVAYLPPIRGEYRLQVAAAPWPGAGGEAAPWPGAGGAAATADFRFTVPESPTRVARAAALVAGLFALGLVSGRIIGQGARAARGAAAAGLMALALVGAASPGRAHSTAAPLPPAVATNGDVRLTLEAQPFHPAVGEPVTLTGQLADARTGQPIPHARVTLQVHHEEDGTDPLAVTFVAPGGGFSWRHTFADGAPHRVRVAAASSLLSQAFAPVEADLPIEVEPVDPPLAVRLQGLALLLAATAAGQWVGYRWTQRRGPTRVAPSGPAAVGP